MAPGLELVKSKRGNGNKGNRSCVVATVALSLVLLACDQNEIEKGRISLSLGDYPMATRFFQTAVERSP